MIKNFLRYKFLFLVITVIVFMVRSIFLIDPDFGWHLKMGEIIANRGIPFTDQFSYTMPSFHHVDHEWFIDLLTYHGYLLLGQIGFSILYSVLAIGAFLLALYLSRYNNKYIYSTLFLLAIATVFPFFGIRPQVLSWFLVALLFRLLLVKTIAYGVLFIMPVLFLIWANVHASFGAGLALFAVITVLRSIRLRRLQTGLVISLFISAVFTLINPYGFGIWKELWFTISDTNLRWRIQEWYPSIFFFNVPYMLLIALSLFAVVKYRTRFTLEELGVYGVLFFQALSSVRHVPLWVIATLPLIARAFMYFEKDIQKIKFGPQRFNKMITITLGASIVIYLATGALSGVGLKDHANGRVYPDQAIAYLKDNQPEGNLFAPYGWGGYLIWQMPEKKLFIDGRMPSWRWNENPDTESANAMDDYLNILSGTLHFKYQFEKYNIDTVLWSKSPEIARTGLKAKFSNYIDKLTGSSFGSYDFIKDLEKNNWQKVYEDDVSVIYTKPVVH